MMHVPEDSVLQEALHQGCVVFQQQLMVNAVYFIVIQMFMELKALIYFLYSELKMSEDICDGIPSEEKPEGMQMPSDEVLPRESAPHLVEAEILHESTHEEHGQSTQSASDGQEGDILINKNPVTEKVIESLPSNGGSAEDMPTECNETVSLDAEPDSEETLHEQSSSVSNTFFSIKALPSLLCKDRILYNVHTVFHKNLGSYIQRTWMGIKKLNCNTKPVGARNSSISLCQYDISLVFLACFLYKSASFGPQNELRREQDQSFICSTESCTWIIFK